MTRKTKKNKQEEGGNDSRGGGSSTSGGRRNKDGLSMVGGSSPPPHSGMTRTPSSPSSPQMQQQQQGSRNRRQGCHLPHSQHRSNHPSSSSSSSQSLDASSSRKSRTSIPRSTASSAAATTKKNNCAAHQFPLITSADHTFVITRNSYSSYSYSRLTTTSSSSSSSSSLPQQPRRSFQGIDASISWEAVRLVNYHCYLQPLSVKSNSNPSPSPRVDPSAAAASCPICLDDLSCPRITKCGHVFCLPCLIHHLHSAPVATAAAGARHSSSKSNNRCPCCAAELHLDDVKPCRVVHHVAPPKLSPSSSSQQHPQQQQVVLRFVKLHRVKACSAPYLPVPSVGNHKRSHVSGLPCQGDDDEFYSRFAYVHSELVLNELRGQWNDLVLRQATIDDEQERRRQWRQQRQQLSRATITTTSDEAIEAEQLEVLSHKWAMQFVQSEIDTVHREKSPEEALQREFDLPSYGMRQPMSPHLFYKGEGGRDDDGGAVYLESPDDEYVFYQAEDGRLCFLSPYNLKCLQHEFSTCMPARRADRADDDDDDGDGDDGKDADTDDSPRGRRRAALSVRESPLPDVVQGSLLDVERFQLTPEVRHRLRFLSHLPPYTELCFAEINLGKLLSKETKRHFAKEFYSRQQQRAAKVRAEQRERDRDHRLEQQRIQDLKNRFQSIDPTDPFFRSFVPPSEEELNVTSEDFGPRLTGTARAGPGTGGASAVAAPEEAWPIPQEPASAAADGNPAPSFSQMVRRGDAAAAGGGALNVEDFPALGATPVSPPRHSPPPPRPWGDRSALK